MSLRGLCLVAAMLVIFPAHALTVKAPDMAENGAVVPVEISLSAPLGAGQQLELIVNGEMAARVKVGKGKLRSFHTRVKGSRVNTNVSARVLANGRELDTGSRNVRVTMPAPVGGTPSAAGPIKIRSSGGSATLLIASQNGYAGTLVLSGADLQVEIVGSTSLSKNPLIGIRGDFSGNVTASINGQTMVATASPPREDTSAAARAREEARQQQRRTEQAQMERQRAEQARAQREKEARDAAETQQALGQLADALVQYQQAKVDRKQARYEEQQRQLQAQREQQRRIQEQQRIAYEAEAARAEAAREAERRASQQQANNQRATQPVAGTVIRDRSNAPQQQSGAGANYSGSNNRTPASNSSSTRREPRRNVPDALAVKCLTVNTSPGYGGFINSCPFSVEFSYCAYRPKKGAWTESFNCEQNQFGSWQVGPNNRTAVHTKNAEKIFWAACRYSGPDGKPLGISPMDARWDAQKRTVTFRCGEWGSGGSG
jgi:predicted secreted protein